MRIKHPEHYQSYRDVNHISPISRVIWIIVIALLIIGISGGFVYQQIQKHQATEQIQIDALQRLTKNVANLDTEPEAINYLKYTAEPIVRLKIGSPIKLAKSNNDYSQNLTGYNYPIVDYFKIRQSNYYLRLIFTSNTKEKFQTMLLNEKQYNLYQQFDQLQSNFAKSIKTAHEYDGTILVNLHKFKQQHPNLHN